MLKMFCVHFVMLLHVQKGLAVRVKSHDKQLRMQTGHLEEVPSSATCCCKQQGARMCSMFGGFAHTSTESAGQCCSVRAIECKQGERNESMRMCPLQLFVIGGGAAGKESLMVFSDRYKEQGLDGGRRPTRIGIADWVDPRGAVSSWGFGGTCLLRGCIPKNLLHIAARLPEAEKPPWITEGFADFEMPLSNTSADRLDMLKQRIFDFTSAGGRRKTPGMRNHPFAGDEFKTAGRVYAIRDVYFHTKVELIDVDESYVHLRLREHQVDSNIVNVRDVYAEHIVIATGVRPYVPDGLENSLLANSYGPPVTSDDFFWPDSKVGSKSVVLIYGGGYIALEIAGVLKELRPDARVMVGYRGLDPKGGGIIEKQPILRGFDPLLVNIVRQRLEALGVEFVAGLQATQVGDFLTEERISPNDVDVIVATGRRGNADTLGTMLPRLVSVDSRGYVEGCDSLQARRADGKGFCHDRIWVAGDIVAGTEQLVTVATKQGELVGNNLAKSLSAPAEIANWSSIPFPSAVYTPLELFQWIAQKGIDLSPAKVGRWGALLEFESSDDSDDPRLLQIVSQTDLTALPSVCGKPPSAVIIIHAPSWNDPIQAIALTHAVASELGQALMFGLEAGITPAQLATTLRAFPRHCGSSLPAPPQPFQAEKYTWGQGRVLQPNGVRIEPAYQKFAMDGASQLYQARGMPSFWYASYVTSDVGVPSEGETYPRQKLEGLELFAPAARLIGNALETYLDSSSGPILLDSASGITKITLQKRGMGTHENGGMFLLPEARAIHPTNTEALAERAAERC